MEVVDKHGEEIKPGHLLQYIPTGETRAVREIIIDKASLDKRAVLKTLQERERKGEYVFQNEWIYDTNFNDATKFKIVGTLDTLMLEHPRIAYDKNETILEQGLIFTFDLEESDECEEIDSKEYIIKKVNFMSAYIAEIEAENVLTRRKSHFTWYPENAYRFEIKGEYGEF